ncbi:unnamed protein product, partial [marine sediment metagenome]
MKYMTALLYAILPLAVAQAEETVRVFPAAELRAMEIRTEGGDIRVQGGDAQEIEVRIVKPDSTRCEITLETEGRTLVLKARSKSRWFRRSGCLAGFRVQAPKSLSLEAASGSGDIRVTELNCALDLKVGSGDIQLYDVIGNLTAKSGSGDLKGNMRSGRVQIKSGSGSISLGGLSGSADVKAGSG